MSRTLEIPASSWSMYLDSVSRRAYEQPVRLEVQSSDLGNQELAKAAPLIGIALESKGTVRDHLDVAIRTESGDFEHHVAQPNRIFAELNDAGRLMCLEVEDAAGGKMLIYFDRFVELPAFTGEEAQASGPVM